MRCGSTLFLLQTTSVRKTSKGLGGNQDAEFCTLVCG